MTLERPKVVRGFASQAMQGDYLPVKFGTNIVSKDLDQIANENFEYGLESLEKDLQLKDLNTILFYHGQLINYLYQKGVAEFSAYESYKSGSVVSHNNGLWIATQDIKPSLTMPKVDSCNPCATQCNTSAVCGEAKEPSKENGWCKLVTHCQYDTDKQALEDSIQALSTAVRNLKGVETFVIENNLQTGKPELVINLSDGSKQAVPMDKFGSIKQANDGTIKIINADGSTITLPKYVAANELDQSRGFLWNQGTNKWEVDLADLLRSGSGLIVDRGGNLGIDPDYTKARDDLTKQKANDAKDQAVREAAQAIANNGATVKLNPNSGLAGNGTNSDPLRINHSNQFELIDGRLHLKPNLPKYVTDLNNPSEHLRQLGFTMFVTWINKTAGDYAIGVPADAKAEGEQTGTTSLDQITNDYGGYDYNGWQIASGLAVTQYLSQDGITWTRENDHGMNADGTLKNPNGWSNWRRVDNINVSTAQVSNLVNNTNRLGNEVQTLQQQNQVQQQAIDELKRKVAALEKPCEVSITNAGSITVNNDHNVIVSNGGTVTFPNNLKVGRSFTVIRSGSGEVTLAGVQSAKGNKLSEQNTAVTVIVTATGVNRAFGSLKQ